MYSLLDRYFGGILKRYLLFVLIGAPVSVIFGLWVLGNSDNSVSSVSERVYETPQSRDVVSDEQGANLSLVDKAASQYEKQGGQPPPPNKDPNLEELDRVKVIQARLSELVPAGTVVTQDSAEVLEILNLQEEMLKLQQERGRLVIEGGDPFLDIKLNRLMLSNMTDDNRLPVSVGVEMVDLLVEGGDVDGAARVYMATQRAMENGDEFFTPEHWAEREMSEQGGGEASTVTTEPKPGHHADGHVHDTPTLQPSVPQAAKGVEAELSGGISQERFDKGRQLIGRYGTEEGLRRLRESDPDMAQRFERLATPKGQLPEQPEPKMDTEP